MPPSRPSRPTALALAGMLLAASVGAAEAPGVSRVVAVPRAAVASQPIELVREGLAQHAAGPIAGDLVLVETGGGVAGTLRYRQEIEGVPVLRGEHLVALGLDGTPLATIIGEVADPGDPGAFVLTALEAAALADAALSGGAADDAARGTMSTVDAAPGWTGVTLPTLPASGYARQVIHPRGPRAAWRIEIPSREDPEDRWCVIVDARDGAVIEVSPLTNHAAASGRVFPRGFLRGSEMRTFVDPDVNMDVVSPAGWIATDRTIGNNAYVWEDRVGDGTATEGLTAIGVGDPLVFDFPVTGVPLDDLDAALTNVFWAVNEAHDRFRRLGFDERSGALQTSNFGRGGIANDYLRVFVQYRAGASATGIRNSNTASTSADGNYASITVGLWDRSGEIRDGAFDTGLVFHEYAHHVVVRMLLGDGTCDDGTQPAGLAEGWADFFGASFTDDPVVGAYVSGNADAGIRTAAINRSTFTYSNLCATNPASTNCSSTENGEIWAGTLWDLRGAMIRAYGPAGVERTERLVVEGLRYTPCRPTYLEARDGILLADLALTGGVDRCLIWQIMANRGFGFEATTMSPDDRYPIGGYMPGPECVSTASVAWDRPRYGDDADARLQVSDGTCAASSRTLRVETIGGDVEDVILPAPARGPGLVRHATVALRPGAALPGDGVVQVAQGETVTATCIDCPGRPAAAVPVSRSLSLAVLTHQLSNETCHDDDSDPAVPDFINELPSLLDAGEIATVAVTLGNAEDFPLEDVRVTVTCDNPDVQVIPRGEIRVGRVGGRWFNPAPFVVSLRAVVAASPAVVPGDTATLTFLVRARGLEGTTALTMDLAGDYVAERGVRSWGGVETFETSSPSAALWTHAPAGGRPADAWALQDCGNGGGRAMAYMGPACGTYDDASASAVLTSPPIFDFSNRVQAVHLQGINWWNDVELGYALRSPNYCDSEMVAAYLTDNPNRPNFVRPRDDRGSSLQYWVNWPGLNVERNTAGWVQAFPQTTISTTSVSGMRLADVRLLWAFFTDVLNPQNDGGCRITDPDGVARGYALDDVSVTYDLARLIPAVNTTCARTCAVRTVTTITPPGGARCAGDTITISAEGSEAAGCAGVLEYRFTGPGLDTGWISATSVTTNAVDGATWAANVRCSTDTGCSQQVGVADPTLDDVDVGRVRPGTLRMGKRGGEVLVSWDGTRSPPSYAIFRADSARDDVAGRIAGFADIVGTPPSDALRAGSADGVEWLDTAVGRGGLSVYRAFGRAPCAGTALDR